MTDNTSDIAMPVGTLMGIQPIQSYTIKFHNGTEVVGKLDFNGPKMTFEGSADESVDALVRAFGHWFDGRLKQEREAEREECKKICEDMGDHAEKNYVNYPHWTPWEAARECALKIKLKG